MTHKQISSTLRLLYGPVVLSLASVLALGCGATSKTQARDAQVPSGYLSDPIEGLTPDASAQLRKNIKVPVPIFHQERASVAWPKGERKWETGLPTLQAVLKLPETTGRAELMAFSEDNGEGLWVGIPTSAGLVAVDVLPSSLDGVACQALPSVEATGTWWLFETARGAFALQLADDAYVWGVEPETGCAVSHVLTLTDGLTEEGTLLSPVHTLTEAEDSDPVYDNYEGEYVPGVVYEAELKPDAPGQEKIVIRGTGLTLSTAAGEVLFRSKNPNGSGEIGDLRIMKGGGLHYQSIDYEDHNGNGGRSLKMMWLPGWSEVIPIKVDEDGHNKGDDGYFVLHEKDRVPTMEPCENDGGPSWAKWSANGNERVRIRLKGILTMEEGFSRDAVGFVNQQSNCWGSEERNLRSVTWSFTPWTGEVETLAEFEEVEQTNKYATIPEDWTNEE